MPLLLTLSIILSNIFLIFNLLCSSKFFLQWELVNLTNGSKFFTMVVSKFNIKYDIINTKIE